MSHIGGAANGRAAGGGRAMLRGVALPARSQTNRRDPRAIALGALCAGLLAVMSAGCGADEQRPAPPRYDDAFALRIVDHQQTAIALARSASAAGAPAVRELARRAVATRRRTLPALRELAADAPPQERLPDLGVPPQTAADEIRPDALRGARPLDAAFLTVMLRHDEGALALVRAELRRGREPATKAVAQQLATDLTAEVSQLSRALAATARQQAE